MGFNCEYFKSAVPFAFQSIREGTDQGNEGDASRRAGGAEGEEAKEDKQKERWKKGRRDSDSHETEIYNQIIN